MSYNFKGHGFRVRVEETGMIEEMQGLGRYHITIKKEKTGEIWDLYCQRVDWDKLQDRFERLPDTPFVN